MRPRRLLGAVLAVLAAVAAVLVLPAASASAATAAAAVTRVGAQHAELILAAGVSRPVSPVQGRCRELSQPRIAVGACVAAEDGASAAEDAAASCGGMSFTAGTKVLLASGAAVPISQLKPGDKVLATNTKTGRTQAEAVTAVLVHHDTDLYDLKIRDHGKISVINTTSSHLFWVRGSSGGGRWVKAGSLRYGTHLRTLSGSDLAVVTGGWVPAQRDGWMWDLTVPGNNDHDFYIDTTTADVLVHNCPMVGEGGTQVTSRTLTQNEDFRIDVENPNPGVRPGQLHLQDYAGNKYQYNFESGEFEGLPNSLARQVARNPAVARAIATGLRYLGMGG